MKKEFQYLAFGLFLVVIVALIFGSYGVEAYSKPELFSKEYKYEGMEGDVVVPEADADAEKKEKEKEEVVIEEPTMPAPESMAVMGPKPDPTKKETFEAPTLASLFSSDNAAAKKDATKTTEPMMIFGIDKIYEDIQKTLMPPKKDGFTLSPAQYGGIESNDKFAAFADTDAVSTGATCISGGLSNSRGPLCLSPELMEILRTRGGNASGR